MNAINDITSALANGIAEEAEPVLLYVVVKSSQHFFCVSHYEHNRLVDWAKVIITLADDRNVPDDHFDSNRKLIRSQLLLGPRRHSFCL